MTNETNKQINQMKIFHNLSISENTSGSKTAGIEADKERRQAKTTKKLSSQLHSEQISNKKKLNY
jgi:hypothetical protein